MKRWNKIHFNPGKNIESITSLLGEKMNEERGWKKDFLVSQVTQKFIFKQDVLLLFLKPDKNQGYNFLEFHESVKSKDIILHYSKCLKIVKFYLKKALWETTLDHSGKNCWFPEKSRFFKKLDIEKNQEKSAKTREKIGKKRKISTNRETNW